MSRKMYVKTRVTTKRILICAAAYSSLLLSGYATAYGFVQTVPNAPASPSNAYECTQVSLEDIDPALLTKEERIALLDGSLKDSIDNYSTCVSTVQQKMSAGGGGGAGGDGGAGSGESAEGQGEGANNEGPTGEGVETETLPVEQQNQPPQSSGKQITPAQRGVIPPKDNDKIICKLLFKEINTIDDPDMLRGLKEQYSNYKCG